MIIIIMIIMIIVVVAVIMILMLMIVIPQEPRALAAGGLHAPAAGGRARGGERAGQYNMI